MEDGMGWDGMGPTNPFAIWLAYIALSLCLARLLLPSILSWRNSSSSPPPLSVVHYGSNLHAHFSPSSFSVSFLQPLGSIITTFGVSDWRVG
jgi:hypothetical protein